MHATQHPTDNKQLLSQLCHMVALSETKKIEGVADSFVLNVIEIDLAHPATDQAKIDEALRIYFGIQFEARDLNASITRLLQSESIIKSPTTGALALSPGSRIAQSGRVADAANLEQIVMNQWLSSIQDLFTVWSDQIGTELWTLLKSYLAKLFRRHGAQTVFIVSGHKFQDVELEKTVGSLVTEAIAEECKLVDSANARKALRCFFNQQTPERARYIAQLLDGTFSFYTLFTDDATQDYLKRAIPRITIFLDTNFLFGVLNLHNNPQNEVSVELIALVRDQQLPFDFYYHEDSLQEMQETIAATQKRLSQVAWSSGLSRAAITTRPFELIGLELKYHEANAQHQIDPATFFLKYRHVEKLVNERGFKIYRRPNGARTEKIDEETADLISAYTKFLETRWPHHRQKSFSTIKHDIVVWKAAKALRRTGTTGLDVGALLLSADQRLFAFDWGILSERDSLGVVVLPSQLLQLLRPFVPRTPDFDKKFAEVFALPEFRSAHTDFFQVTRKVLQFLASVKDLSEETASAILADELLLRRLKDVETDEELRAVIESEVLTKNAALIEKHSEVASQLESTRSEGDRKQALLLERERELLEKEILSSAQAAALEQERLGRRKQEDVSAAISKESAQILQQLEKVKTEKVELEKHLISTEASLSKHRKTLRGLGVAGFTAIGWGLLIWFPMLQSWDWLQNHQHKIGLYLSAFLLVAGLAWSIFGWKGRLWALAAIVLAVIVQLIQVL